MTNSVDVVTTRDKHFLVSYLINKIIVAFLNMNFRFFSRKKTVDKTGN